MATIQQYRTSFSLWLRTGRWVAAQLADPGLEVKFNPYHDPRNGQFTFAPGGGAGSSADRPRSLPPSAGRRLPNDPKHPRNFSIYVVKAGDTLQHIAATRVGLTSADLIWLNDLPNAEIKTGQRLRVPHQVFLDEGNALSTLTSRYKRIWSGMEAACRPTLHIHHHLMSKPSVRARALKRGMATASPSTPLTGRVRSPAPLPSPRISADRERIKGMLAATTG